MHSVYIAYDAYGNPLYAGRTSKGERRLRQHGKAALWWPQVAKVAVTHYATREEAALREFEAIRMLRPEFNVEVPTALRWPPEWTDIQKNSFRRRWPLVVVR